MRVVLVMGGQREPLTGTEFLLFLGENCPSVSKLPSHATEGCLGTPQGGASLLARWKMGLCVDGMEPGWSPWNQEARWGGPVVHVSP